MKKYWFLFIPLLFLACKKNNGNPDPDPPAPGNLSIIAITLDGNTANNYTFANAAKRPLLVVKFNTALQTELVNRGILIADNAGSEIATINSFSESDSTVTLQVNQDLSYLTIYNLVVANSLRGKSGESFTNNINFKIITPPDTSVNHFPIISDDALLTLVQQQTFKYFWDFGHPVSGLARERNTSGDVVTTGGSGFGIMAIISGVHRGFITRSEGLTRIATMVDFLSTRATRYHGAFSHWLNGSTGATVPFSPNDNGADLVETSFLMEGLLCARQYFDGSTTEETSLRAGINSLWEGVEWNWFRKDAEDVLYWHWSPDKAWIMNHQVKGWNECFVTYILAASSPTDSIPLPVYKNGWASNGGMANGNAYYGITLPLGTPLGGPLFFTHYSFMGIDPNNLIDIYADYGRQNEAHAMINHLYCAANPKKFNGYSEACWGLTASDEQGGYSAHEPNNDNGTISPTAAVASLPYAPEASMKAIRFFYYKLGDRLWGEYGFKDAFNLNQIWFADSYLAIDQGPQVVMIENYRSQLLWDLFMSCPEVKSGMLRLGFSSPHF